MQTSTAMSNAPTHVAFFDFAPDSRTPFHFSPGATDEYDRTIIDLMSRFPGKGIPTIELLSAPPEKPIDVAAIAESIAREGSGCAVSEEALPKLSTIQLASGPKPVSTWESTSIDDEAKARIDAQQAKLAAAGVSGLGRELFAKGTRMADVGYENQARRAVEHEKRLALRDAAEALIERVRSEKRTDLVTTARELSKQVTINGALKLVGFKLQDQAIRGLLTRADSPATAYVFGLRNRIAANVRSVGEGMSSDEKALIAAKIGADKRELAQVLAHELEMAGDVEVKLRTRARLGDVFAAVSPKYSAADAPEVLAEVLKGLPRDAKGSWSYDPETTSWELRAEVWTPTPVAEQAVGEPFRGYVSFRSKDNGAGLLTGGGGIEILACLNASTYVADASSANRRHVGRIVADVEAMVATARRSIDVLCDAWGDARETELALPPEYEAQLGIPISQAIPGFWHGEFGDRRSELSRVLRGSTKAHVAGLTDATISERDNRSRGDLPLSKADLAQGWTRYVQRLPSDERRDGEAAIASWVVSRRPARFDGERVEG